MEKTIDNYVTFAASNVLEHYHKQIKMVEEIASDASMRKYQRINYHDGTSHILMHSPVQHYDINHFIDIGRWLKKRGVNTPEIYKEDKTNGVLLIEDLGRQTLKQYCASNHQKYSEEELYIHAIDVIVDINKNKDYPDFLQPYDLSKMMQEVMAFTEYYLPLLIGSDQIKQDFIDEYQEIWESLLSEILAQSTMGVVLRDYHSENLMIAENQPSLPSSLGIIDFQDAVIGPIEYDIVSLLDDARRELSPSLKSKLIKHFLKQYPALSQKEFLSHYHIIGTQRNCKIMGYFARLSLNNNNKHLQYLPLVVKYIRQSSTHPKLRKFELWLNKVLNYYGATFAT